MFTARCWRLLLVITTLGCCLAGCVWSGVSVRKTSRSYSQYIMGLLADRLGNAEDAAVHYTQTQHLDKAAPAPYLQLGLSYVRLKKYAQAVPEFEKVISLTPDDEVARYCLALLYVQLGDLKKAIGQFHVILDNHLNQKAENIQLRRILSQLYFLNKDFTQALGQADAMLALDPLDKDALYSKALIYSEEGRPFEAIKGFEEFLKAYPDSDEAMNSLAYVYAENNMKLDEALALAEKAVAAVPASGAYLDTLGWVYFKLGANDKAIESLERAAQLEVDPLIFNHLAEAYYKKGRIDDARRYWVSSLAFDPTQKEIRLKLKTLTHKL